MSKLEKFDLVLSDEQVKDRVVAELDTFKEALKEVVLMHNVQTEEAELWIELKNGYATRQYIGKGFIEDAVAWKIAEEAHDKVSSLIDAHLQ